MGIFSHVQHSMKSGQGLQTTLALSWRCQDISLCAVSSLKGPLVSEKQRLMQRVDVNLTMFNMVWKLCQDQQTTLLPQRSCHVVSLCQVSYKRLFNFWEMELNAVGEHKECVRPWPRHWRYGDNIMMQAYVKFHHTGLLASAKIKLNTVRKHCW